MGMDVNKLMKMIKSTPEELWQDEETILSVIEELENDSGKTYSDDQKKKYVQQFKRFAGDPAARSLLPFLLKSGRLDQLLKKL